MITSENGLLVAAVLLNVQGRDVGGFVEEAKSRLGRDVSLPPGYFLGWSGRWENQERARQQLMIVLPVVLAIIFVLLYFTYHSAVEAAHVLLAVPFALSGGIYLVWLLGYNFSVAVWVGFIALFGTAVQTGVVMVIYLEEAVQRKGRELGGPLTAVALREAVMEGALLRLRPKVMTVSTVVASLLPIMWSTRVGAEVMKPLAAPVLGGMVSSLLHVLVVTPVLFLWLQERRLGLVGKEKSMGRIRIGSRGWIGIGIAVLVVVAGGLITWTVASRTTESGISASEPEIQRAASGDVQIVLRSADGALRQGRNTFTIEFRRPDGSLFDPGTVSAAANMPMPGMPMSSGLQVTPSVTTGRYVATGEFGMAGTWQFAIQWEGPDGRGSATLEATVR
jgi:hypothetical protein